MKKLIFASIGLVVFAAIFIVIGLNLGQQKNPETTININTSGDLDHTKIESRKKTKGKDIDLNELMEKVKAQFPTIKETMIYTEESDPNNVIGKPGYYIAGAAFWDERTNRTYDPDEKWGAGAGGSIEVYESEADATKRVKYLESFQGGGFLDPGRFTQIEEVVVRASDEFSNSQQLEIIDFLTSQIK